MTTAAKVEFKATAQFNPVFRPVNEWRGRYRILKGSAGSGKSVNIAQDYIAKLSDPAYTGANLLVVRKIEETNRDSTFAELQAAIYRMFGPYAERFWKVNLNPLALECKITGNRIIFRGVKDQRQREKVKSITFKNGKLVWIWCEEATELLSEDVDILDDRLRGKLDGMAPALGMKVLPVSPADAGKTVAQLLGEVETRSARTLVLEPGAYPPAVVLANFKEKDVDTLLDLMKQAQVTIPLKAVVTPSNRSWVFGDLLAHLQEEHAAFTAAKENHTV